MNEEKPKEVENLRFEINLPGRFQIFFNYIKQYFGLSIKEYLERIVILEIKSRNSDLNIFKSDLKENYQEIPWVVINNDLYKTLKQVSKITGIPIEKIINYELNELIFSILRHDPLIFIDHFLDIEKVKDPLKLLKELKPIVGIPDHIIESFKDMDLKKYMKEFKKL